MNEVAFLRAAFRMFTSDRALLARVDAMTDPSELKKLMVQTAPWFFDSEKTNERSPDGATVEV
jgi:hypothetical protein